VKYLFLFSFFFFWQQNISTSTDISIITSHNNKGKLYFADKRRQPILELFKGSDIESYVESDECVLFKIINDIVENRDINEDLNDFFSCNFDLFRALFIVPDEKSILNDLQSNIIINLSHDNLISFAKKTEKTDLRLQLWIFVRLTRLYTDELYEESKLKIRNAIVDLGKKIDLVSLPTNDNKESQKPGIDYVGLIFKAINVINYLPNATKESYALTTLLNDIKVRLDTYVNEIQ